MSYAELMLQRAVQAINSDVGVEHDWSDLSTYDFSDPVALITEAEDRKPLEQIAGLDYSEFERNFTSAQGRARGRHQEVAQKAQRGPVDPIIDVPNYATMTTNDFALKMLAREGAEYEWGGTTRRGGYDCSGLINRIMTNNGFANFPRHSSAIYEHSNKISVKKAIKTRGAILYTPGHIAVSLGNGKTIEARGEDYGVVIGNAEGRFTHGGLLPELKVGMTAHETRRKGRKPSQQGIRTVADPINRIESVSSLTAAPMVFGTIMGEVNDRPTTKRGWDSFTKEPGLGFVPANRRAIFKAAAEKYGISARLLASMGVQESGLRHITTPNSAGAVGPLQVIPRWHPQFDETKLAQNYRYNVMAGAAIFASYLEKAGGNLRLALAYYNAGPSADRDVLERVMVSYSDPILERFRGERQIA